MYLVIFEDGSITHHLELDDSILPAADVGYLDVIDISNPDHPLRYWDEGWCSLDVVPTE